MVIRHGLHIILAILFLTCLPGSSAAQSFEQIAGQVEIRRTSYGVPHVLGENLRAAAFGLAWCELEDYGERVIRPLVAARGDLAMIDGYEAIDQDFIRQMGYERTMATYNRLGRETRALLEGFAAGVTYYLRSFPEKLPDYAHLSFTGVDVAAVTTSVTTPYHGTRFKERLLRQKEIRDSLALTEGGSNAWALAPSRTRDGNAILVRNPHLSWTAGYYEAQITVPDTLNFYGDFRIGGLFAIIGGFNDRLGWATTNNNPDLEEVYALTADTTRVDHYILDGISHPLQRRLVQADFLNGTAVGTETREMLFTPFGPVIHRAEGKVYILKQAGDGEYRRGEQFTRMLLARNLEEWKDAMRMQAITASNYTYADADGHIFYVWNATSPVLSHPSGGDTAAVAVTSREQIWHRIVSFDDLPQLHNPPGGYLHNENDPFHFTNLNQVLQPHDYPTNMPPPRLRQRSQHSLLLVHNDDILTLEDVVERKHSMKMLLADQLKDDLLEIARARKPGRTLRRALALLESWDNSVRADSRGSILFATWFEHYADMMRGKELYATPWSFDQPMTTPDGLANPDAAIKAFELAMETLNEKYGTWDLTWGEVHRLRLGDLDLPVGGGPGGLGCFRVLWFTDDTDGKRKIRGGDGWQLAVEFSDPPRAYSILAYGQSNDPDSPHHTDQAALFANNQMKKVAFSEEAIAQDLIKRYRPGRE